MIEGRREYRREEKKALTALVGGQENDFYFKHLPPYILTTDDTSQLLMLELNTVASRNTVRVTHKPTNTKV